MGLRELNFHKFEHNFKDTINPLCPVSDGIEDTEHFLLLFHSFREQRHSLLAGVDDVLEAYEYSEGSYINMVQLLLYENKNFPSEANKLIINLTIKCIPKQNALVKGYWFSYIEYPIPFCMCPVQ